MPTRKDNPRYVIPDVTDPTRWHDLSLPDAEAAFDVERVIEQTKVYRVLVPAGGHEHGAEFSLFDSRHDGPMDSSWNRGELPRNEVGIVHKVGIGIAPVVCDRRTADDDIAQVLYGGYLMVSIDGVKVLKGSLETFPIGFGIHGSQSPFTNGLPAMDAIPDRYPFLYTNGSMQFEGSISFPARRWLHAELDRGTKERRYLDQYPPAAAPAKVQKGKPARASKGKGKDTESEACEDEIHEIVDPCEVADPCEIAAAQRCVTLSSDVLVTFYMHGVFARVRPSKEQG